MQQAISAVHWDTVRALQILFAAMRAGKPTVASDDNATSRGGSPKT